MGQNNQYKLRLLMLQHNLQVDEIADMLMVKPTTVRSYLYKEGSSNFRNFTDRNLARLKDKINQ